MKKEGPDFPEPSSLRPANRKPAQEESFDFPDASDMVDFGYRLAPAETPKSDK